MAHIMKRQYHIEFKTSPRSPWYHYATIGARLNPAMDVCAELIRRRVYAVRARSAQNNRIGYLWPHDPKRGEPKPDGAPEDPRETFFPHPEITRPKWHLEIDADLARQKERRAWHRERSTA